MVIQGKRMYIRGVLRAYPEAKNKKSDNRTKQEHRIVQDVEQVLHEVSQMDLGEQRVRFIDMVYFRQTHTIEGAAHQLYVCRGTALKWNKNLMDIVCRISNLI